MRRLKLDACLVTLDRDGMYLTERRGPHTYIPTTPRAVYDVTGAGDVVLAVFGLFAIAGLSFASAARLANLAAGIEVSRLGTGIISREDLARALSPGPESAQRKIVVGRGIAPGARAPSRRGPASGFHQRMLRPAARGACRDALVRARAGRHAGGGSQQRPQRAADQGRWPPDLSGRRAGADSGRARGGGSRGGVRRDARRAYRPRRAPRRAGEGRGLARQNRRRPDLRRVLRRTRRARAAVARLRYDVDDRPPACHRGAARRRRVSA